MDANKLTLAFEIVGGWTESLMNCGYGRKDALEKLGEFLTAGSIVEVYPEAGGMETEIQGIIESQLDQFEN